MAVVLGLLVAAGFGSADFFGGRASERASTIAVLLVAQVVAVGGALLVSFVASARVTSADLGYGGAAGAVSVAGLGFLYRGLAAGRVSVVAPLTAVVGALVPVAWALLSGERPSAVVLIGAGCATVAGGLIAREQHAVGDTDAAFNGVLYALAAGALLGSSLVLFAETGAGSGLIPVLAARLVGLALVVAVFVAVAARSRVVVPHGPARRLAVGAGTLDITSTVLLLLAVRRGLVVVVAPVAALAPAFTVMWAWLIVHERVSAAQVAGLALALVGLVLVASG